MDSITQQADLEKEKESQQQKENDESIINSKEDSTLGDAEDGENYPPFKVVLPVVLSLYLAIFLVSLVGTHYIPQC